MLGKLLRTRSLSEEYCSSMYVTCLMTGLSHNCSTILCRVLSSWQISPRGLFQFRQVIAGIISISQFLTTIFPVPRSCLWDVILQIWVIYPINRQINTNIVINCCEYSNTNNYIFPFLNRTEDDPPEMTSLARLVFVDLRDADDDEEEDDYSTMEDDSRLTLAYENLQDMPYNLVDSFGIFVRTLDLSNNNFRYVDILQWVHKKFSSKSYPLLVWC